MDEPGGGDYGTGSLPDVCLLLDTTARVHTPERVALTFRLAGPGRRAAAWALDAVVRLVIGAGLFAIATSLGALLGFGVGQGAFLLGLFFLWWGYGAGFEWALGGRTPGKYWSGLRVVRHDGSPGKLADFVLRNLLGAADFLPGFFAVGLASMWLDDRYRRLGDLVAGTVVVVEDRSDMLGEVAIVPPVSEDERQALPPRVDLSLEEMRVIEQFVRRLPKLSPERAEELAALFGPSLADRTGVEAPTWTRTLVLAYARATGRER